MTAVTNSNGEISLRQTGNLGANTDATSAVLYGFEQNTLYVIWETQAPSDYQINETPQYFYLRNAGASDYDTTIAAIASYADNNNLYVSAAGITVVDQPQESSAILLPSAGADGGIVGMTVIGLFMVVSAVVGLEVVMRSRKVE